MDSVILQPDLAQMVKEFSEGKETGSPSRISSMDEIFAWKRGFVNCFTGNPNDGKSTMVLFLMVTKAVHDNWKWCIWSPEMISSHRSGKEIKITPSDLVDELIFMKTGKTPYLHFVKKYFVKQISLEEYMEAFEWVMDHFTFVMPQDRTFKGVVDSFQFVYDSKGSDGFLIDPFKNFKQDEMGRTDLVMDEMFHQTKQFAIKTHSVVNYIAHPRSQTEMREKGKNGQQGAYKVVTQHMLAGGAAWDNSMDGIYSIYRPEKHISPTDPKVHFYTLKQRKQNIVARRGVCENIEFEFLTNRFFFDGICPIDGSYSKKMQKSEQQLNKEIFDEATKPIEKEGDDDTLPF